MRANGTGQMTPEAVARRCIIAGFIGFAVDFFDIYLPAMVLTPVITYF
jgi:hypothetical protein